MDTPAFCCRQGGEGVQQLAGDALTAQGGRNVSVIGVDGVRVNDTNTPGIYIINGRKVMK